LKTIASAVVEKVLSHAAQRIPPIQLFLKLFEPYLQWFYHCFDRIVINGHLLGLMREAQVVYFFRDVCGHAKLTKELLRQSCWQLDSPSENERLFYRISRSRI